LLWLCSSQLLQRLLQLLLLRRLLPLRLLLLQRLSPAVDDGPHRGVAVADRDVITLVAPA
jgi:hypothetical protein